MLTSGATNLNDKGAHLEGTKSRKKSNLTERELYEHLKKIFPNHTVLEISRGSIGGPLIDFKMTYAPFQLKHLKRYAKLLKVKNVGVTLHKRFDKEDAPYLWRVYPICTTHYTGIPISFEEAI